MTFSERNEYIDDAVRQFKTLHHKYTGGKGILTDSEWKAYIGGMDAIRELYLNTNLEETIGKLCQIFLDDTEMVQKKLKGELIT